MQKFFYRNRVLIMHLSFWCVTISFFLYKFSRFQIGQQYNWGAALTFAAIQLSFTAVISYINYFILLPRFQESKNIWRYLVEFLPTFTILVVIRIISERYINSGKEFEEYLYSTRFIIQVVTTTLFIVIFVGLLRFVENWFELEAKKKEIENEKLSAELKFLKAQIHPHFLFNTLNNLYYLAYTNSPNTPEVIARLSQMMRYMIYESNNLQVPLTREIEYMQNYISLEKLRLNNQVPINFNIKGNTDGIKIAPLILMPFLENAFKHGISNSDPKAWVNISVEINGNEIIYTVENSKVPVQSVLQEKENEGIGLQNARRRLELSYSNIHNLEINDQHDSFRIRLKLIIS